MTPSKPTTAGVFSLVILLAASTFGTSTWLRTGSAQPPGQQKDAPDTAQKKDRPGDDEDDRDDDDENDDPSMPVIYLHYDYMVKRGANAHSHAPDPRGIRKVVRAFKRQGIRLHIDPQHTAIPDRLFLNFGESPGCADSVNFFNLKTQYFHPRGNHPWHYAIFGHSADHGYVCGAFISGTSEFRGYNFMVTVGEFINTWPEDLRLFFEGGVFMHELGHNLGLQLGGFEVRNYKPNYLSVMNYIYIAGLRVAASPGSTVEGRRRLDYSTQALPTLDENHLNENVGVAAGNTDIVSYLCLPPGHSVPDFVEGFGAGIGPIDWNCNGLIEPDVQQDIDVYFDSYNNNPFSLLVGYDDWANIRSYLDSLHSGNRSVVEDPRTNSSVAQSPETIACELRRR